MEMEAYLSSTVSRMRHFARQANKVGLQTGSGGNLSVRIPGTETMLIKASGGSFSSLAKSEIVLVDFDGRTLAGTSKPSREIHTHALLYKRCPAAAAIFHSHSPWSIACAARFATVPLVTLHMEMKIGAIPILVSEGHSDEKMVGDLTEFLFANPGVKAFIQRRHGIFSMASDIGEAEMQAELVEECAKIAMLELMSAAKT